MSNGSDTILSLEQAAMERWRNGDPMGWAEISADDVIYVDPGLTKPIVGMEEYRAYLKGIEGKVHYQRSEFLEPRVAVYGEAAVLSYNYRSSVLSPEGAVLNQTPWNTTEVYFRRKGEWKIVHTHWSFLKHKLPESLEVPLPVQMEKADYNGLLGEIMGLESAAMERWRKGDPEGFLELYAPEITYFDTGTSQRVNGREAMRQLYEPLKGQIHYDVMDFLAPRLQSAGNAAVLSYRFLSTLLNPDGSVLSRTPWNCSEVYVCMEDGWRIVHNHWSFIRGERII